MQPSNLGLSFFAPRFAIIHIWPLNRGFSPASGGAEFITCRTVEIVRRSTNSLENPT